MQNLAHSASFESLDKDAPSKAETKQFRNDGIVPMARTKVARGIFCALPEIWTRSLTEERLAPNATCTFVQPSLPIVAGLQAPVQA